MLYGDAGHVPYAASANATITLPEMDLSGASGAQINFSSRCDTEYSTSPDAGGDYMGVARLQSLVVGTKRPLITI